MKVPTVRRHEPGMRIAAWWLPLVVAAGCHAPNGAHEPSDLAGPAWTPTRFDMGTTVGPGPNGPDVVVDGPLNFAVFGDTRPPSPNDTAGYPTTIVSGIFKVAQQHNVQFAVGTGDYMFASVESEVGKQLDLLHTAESELQAPVFHTMGNHECTGATASNCPNANETPNVRAFMSRLLPSGVTTPYYRVDVETPMGRAKFLFVAANAWSPAQESWLQAQLGEATEYTFVVRHEPPEVTSPPGVTPSDALLRTHPPTLLLLGHSHTYRRLDSRSVISGNGGAPMSSYGGTSFGLLVVTQEADGNIAVQEIDEATTMPTDSWKVNPAGDNVP
jgi:hypothetical protein